MQHDNITFNMPILVSEIVNTNQLIDLKTNYLFAWMLVNNVHVSEIQTIIDPIS